MGARVIWRRLGLLEAQSPEDGSSFRRNDVWNRRRLCDVWMEQGLQPSEQGAMPSEGVQGDEWDAYLALSCATGTNVGLPTGRGSYRRRRPRSSCRSHARPRRTGEPSAWRRVPGDRTFERREVCGMLPAETVMSVLRERGRTWSAA